MKTRCKRKALWHKDRATSYNKHGATAAQTL